MTSKSSDALKARISNKDPRFKSKSNEKLPAVGIAEEILSAELDALVVSACPDNTFDTALQEAFKNLLQDFESIIRIYRPEIGKFCNFVITVSKKSVRDRLVD